MKVNKSRPEVNRGILRVLRSKRERQTYYDRIARIYDLLAERSERAMREIAIRRLAAASGERILEIGFGTGHCLDKLARAVGPSGKVYGIDLSHNMVSRTDRLLKRERLDQTVQLVCGDAECLPYADRTMDGMLMTFILELFDTPEIPRVLAQCRRVLRPGGRLVVVSVSRQRRRSLMARAFEWTHAHFPRLLDCRPIYVRRSLEAAGLVCESVEVREWWVPVEIVRAVNPS